MTLEQLRIFIAVAERQHMTRAASALNATQSTVSAAIAALEERHDVKLFDRVGRGIALTDAGKIFFAEAVDVVARATNAERVLTEIGDLRRGCLRLVASQTIAGYWLPPRLATFRERYPDIAIDLAIGNTGQAAQCVRDGAAELGFVEGFVDESALARWQLGEDHMVLVSGTAVTGRIDPAWLRNAPWVLREPGSGTRSSFEQTLAAMRVDAADLRIALVMPSNEAVLTAVAAGAGVAVLSALVVGPAIDAGKLHALPLHIPPRPFFGLRHKERHRSRASDAFLAMMDQGSGSKQMPGANH